MPPALRERDPRTGRYISSRGNTEEAGPSVPGAFDESTETAEATADETAETDETVEGIEPIETPESLGRSEASETIEIGPIQTPETLERSEASETSETIETVPDERIRSASGIEQEDPSEQLRAELAVRMATTPIPKPKEANPIKLIQFDIPNLTKQNVRTWKSDVREFCEIQGVWEVVEQTLRRQDKPGELQELLNEPLWASQDATARYYIKKNIQQEDKTSVRDLKNSGAVWKYLMGRYERTTEYDTVILVQRITQWKKDPKVDVEASLQQLEQLNADLYEVSNQKHKFDELMILTMFLNGLPEEYETMRDSLFSNITLERGLILSRLQQKESQLKVAGTSEEAGESANRTEQRKCFNCGKPGHFAKDCRAPKDREQSSSREDSQGKNHWKGRYRKARAHGTGRDKSRRGHAGRQRGKARTADEESDTDSDSSASSSGTTRDSAHRVYERKAHRPVENAYRVELREQISDRFEYLLDEEPERAYWVKGSEDPIIDSGATSTCSGKIDLFESLDQRYGGSLGTAGKSIEIAGRGTIRIPLSNGKVARIRNALYVPRMRQTLLSTQALQDMGIWNEHVQKQYRFFRKRGVILARGYNIGRTSYLGWVGSKNALARGFEKPERESARLVKQTDWELLHRRLGHPGKATFKQMTRKLGLSPGQEVIEELKSCETCIQAKSVKKQSHAEVPRASRPLKRVYMDFWGPYSKAKTLERYYLSLTDDCTRLSWIYLTKDRESATVRSTLEQWLALVEREKGVKLLIIRTDNAKEFKALEPWAEKKGIQIEFTEPETPQQNGVAERLNRHLLELTRAILIDADVPKEYWPYAIRMANYLRNRVVRVRGTKKTPFELWFGYPPDMSKFRIPFSRVWFHKRTSDKMEPRAVEGVFIEYESSRNHYLVMAKRDRKLYRVTNPIFLENKRGFISKEPGIRDLRDEPIFQRIVPDASSGTREGIIEAPGARDAGAGGATTTAGGKNGVEVEVESGNIGESGQDPELTNQRLPQLEVIIPRYNTPSQEAPTQPSLSLSPSPTQIPNELSESRPIRIRKPTQAAIESKQTEVIYGRKPRAQKRREEREALKGPSPRILAAEQRRISEVANLAVALELHLSDHNAFKIKAKTEFDELTNIPIPKTYQEAINDPTYGTKWKEAIKLELNNLIRFGTWRYVRRPNNQAVVSTKWVFDIKYGADGRIDRFKARLVARGFSQREGLDFEDTFAPVIRLESLRILFALAATHGLKAHLLDATNAYVGSKIDKQIFMEIPEGVNPNSHDSNDVCEILQSLYGLRQSAYLWNQKVKKFVTLIGFRQSTADPGVFINDRGVIIALYVDDILIFGKDTKDIESTKDQLKDFHPMKDLGIAQKILGIRITQTKNSIRLDQEFYARSILEEFEMTESTPQDTPLNPSIDLDDESSRKLPRDLHIKFRKIIGRLTYLAGGTRPDIQFPVNRLSQHLADPRDVHLRAVKHLLRYIKGTITYGITYSAKGSDGSEGSGNLVGYSDSSYGNATNHRSTSAYVFMMANGPVSWCSRKQPITAMSTTESEYIAAAETSKQAIWIRHFLAAIRKHPKEPTQLGVDNQGALALASNPVNHLRSKHIRVRYHAIRDFVEHGDVKPFYVPTSDMIADGLTKAFKPEGLKQVIQLLQLESK